MTTRPPNPYPFEYKPDEWRRIGVELGLLFVITFLLSAPTLLALGDALADLIIEGSDQEVTVTQRQGFYQEQNRVRLDDLIEGYREYRQPLVLTYSLFIAFSTTATIALEGGLVWWLAVNNGGQGEFYGFYRPYYRALSLFTLIGWVGAIALGALIIVNLESGAALGLVCLMVTGWLLYLLLRVWYFANMTSNALTLSGGRAFLMMLGGAFVASTITNIAGQVIAQVIFTLLRIAA
jgi:hypothetical protein